MKNILIIATLITATSLYSTSYIMNIKKSNFNDIIVKEKIESIEEEQDLENEYSIQDVYNQADAQGRRMCADIKAVGQSLNVDTPDGIYCVDMDGSGSVAPVVDTYCDMQDGWTLMRDMGTELTYGNIGYHKRSFDWQSVEGSNVRINNSAYPRSPTYLQYYGSSNSQAYIYSYIPSITQALKFVETIAYSGHQNNYAYIRSNDGSYYRHYTQPSIDGAKAEVIIDMTNKNTSSIVYYYENFGIVFLDSIWFK